MLFIMTSSNWDVFHITGPFVRGIHQLQVNSLHKGQWQRALVLSLICAWINCWVNNLEAGDLRHHCAHYDVTVIYHAYLVFDLFGRVCEEHWGGGVTATHLGLCSLEGGDEGRVEKGRFWEAETRSHISGHTKIGVLEFKAQKMSYERPVKFMGGLVQICSNSIASAQWSYSSLALSHRFHTFKASKEAVVLENTDLCMKFGNIFDWYQTGKHVYSYIDGILPKGLFPPCLRMADSALLAGYPRHESLHFGGMYEFNGVCYAPLVLHSLMRHTCINVQVCTGSGLLPVLPSHYKQDRRWTPTNPRPP